MLRLFTCIWIPEEMRGKVVRFQEEMKRLPMKAKFVERENLHITVTFLGNKDEGDLGVITEGLDEVASRSRKFHVNLEGLMVIPSEKRIRVIGVHASPPREVGGLIDRVCASTGGDHHGKAKMTLCRVNNVSDKTAVINFIEQNKDISFGRFEVGEVCLVKSTITGKGPVYETIHRALLR